MKWLGFIVLLATLLISMPVMAIGVSPYTVNISVNANSYTELVFTVSGCSSVDVSLENIPLTVEPSHVSVVDGKITVKILGNLSVPSGVYAGYLVILEFGQQVGAGVKVNLTVNHINNQSGWYGWGGGGWGGTYISPTPDAATTIWFPPVITPIVTPPTVSPVKEGEPEPYQPVTGEPLPQQAQANLGMIILIGGMVLAVGLLGWYIWKKRTSIPS